VSAVPLLDFRWVAFATLVIVLEIPLLALRWGNVVAALAARNERMTHIVMIAITAIGQFFVQVLPSVAGDGVRAWLLARLGCDWPNAVTSVVIDRAIGVGLLVAFGFAILLLPSGLAALGGYRDAMLLLYGGLLLAGDKTLTKKVLRFHGIRTPEFATIYRGALDWAGDLQFPVIVKPPQEDASLGISSASVVRELKDLFARIDELQAEYQQPVLVEQFIEHPFDRRSLCPRRRPQPASGAEESRTSVRIVGQRGHGGKPENAFCGRSTIAA